MTESAAEKVKFCAKCRHAVDVHTSRAGCTARYDQLGTTMVCTCDVFYYLPYCDGCGVRIVAPGEDNPDLREVARLVPFEKLDMVRLESHAKAAASTYQRSYETFEDRDHASLCHECTIRYLRQHSQDDPVSHPKHYTFGKLEVIEVIEDWGWGLPFCLANVVKYIARAGRKDPSKLKQDLEKARWYLDRAISIVTKEGR